MTGGTELIINWGNLEKYFEDLEKVAGQGKEIETYAKEQVFDKSGFDYDLCVLKPLADMMDTLGGVFADLRSTFDERFDDLRAALALAAEDIEKTDGLQEHGYLKPFIELAGES